MEIPLQIAVITTLATILSVIINQSINIWTTKKNEKRDKINLTISMLNDHKKSLESAKIKLSEISKIDVDKKMPLALQAAKNVEHQYFYTLGILNENSHLLNEERVKEIRKLQDMITNKLADNKILANEYSKKSGNEIWEKEIRNNFELSYKLMPKVINLIEESIENELSTVMKYLRHHYE